MAIEKQETIKKIKKPLLAIGLTLLCQTLFTLIGFFLLGSLAFLYNAVTLFSVVNICVAAEIGLVKGAKFLINKVKNKSQSREKGLKKERTRDEEQTLETIPETKEELAEEEMFEQGDNISKKDNAQNVSRRL